MTWACSWSGPPVSCGVHERVRIVASYVVQAPQSSFLTKNYIYIYVCAPILPNTNSKSRHLNNTTP